MIGNVTHHHGASSDHRIAPDGDLIDNRCTDADKAQVSDTDTTSQHDPRRKLSAAADLAIMINGSAGIDDDIVSDLRACLHYCTRENNGSGSDPYVGANDR